MYVTEWKTGVFTGKATADQARGALLPSEKLCCMLQSTSVYLNTQGTKKLNEMERTFELLDRFCQFQALPPAGNPGAFDQKSCPGTGLCSHKSSRG